MHTYYSALPFTPHNTCLYHLYKQETSHSITVLQSLDATWTSYLSSVPTSGHIQSISPDGTWLAVCSKVRSIEILDARTTAYQCSIPGMSNTDCLAFSPSESTLATVNCKRLELWNTTTGNHQKTQTLRGTYFYAIAFSLRGQYPLLSIDQSLHLHDMMAQTPVNCRCYRQTGVIQTLYLLAMIRKSLLDQRKGTFISSGYPGIS